MFAEGEQKRRKRRAKRTVEDKKAVAEALALLGQSRVASNLNQLAHHANLGVLIVGEEEKAQIADPRFQFQRNELVARQRKERDALLALQEERRIAELKTRLPKGLRAAFLKITGQYQTLVAQAESDTRAALERDRAEQQRLIERHLTERRALEREARQRGVSLPKSGPQQALDLPRDDLPFTKAQLQCNPALVLSHISKTKAQFCRVEVLRDLVKRMDDPMALSQAADAALASPEVVRLPDDGKPLFTTRAYQEAEASLHATTQSMAETCGFATSDAHIAQAMKMQDRQLRKAFGGRLSDEQRQALHHILGKDQLACVVGLAGAGKSTMLATAAEAWRRQGVTVHGAALAGKAADGLEEASDIPSRTLASLETSWENGYEPIARGDVLVVDEAGMIGTRQLGRIAAKINEIGAKLVLVGDPDQLQPIEAGTPFRDVVDRIGAARLSEIHRQRDDWQKQASCELAEGKINEAVQSYEEHKAVTRKRSRDEALEALVETYAMDAAADGNSTRLAFAHRRKDVHALNQAIRVASSVLSMIRRVRFCLRPKPANEPSQKVTGLSLAATIKTSVSATGCWARSSACRFLRYP